MRLFKSELFRNLALSLVSTILLLLGLEAVLRVTHAVPVHSLEYASPESWSANPGPLLPGQRFTDLFKRGLPYEVSVNNLGFRGPDVTLEKPPGTARILCLGDSYTYGAYVNNDETWPAQLQQVLSGRTGPLRPEVINAGISGYTIVDELAFLREQGMRLEPDIVVVAFVLNDLADLTREVSSREMIRRSIEENARSLLGPLKVRLRQTAIYNSLFLIKAAFRKATGNDPTIQRVDIRHLLKEDYDDRTLELFDRYRSHLAEMKALIDTRGGGRVRLVFMIFPYWEQISQHATDQAQSRLTRMAEELGIPSLDLLPSYRMHDPGGERFFHMPLDHHPSAAGYRQAAVDLAAVLEPMLEVTDE